MTPRPQGYRAPTDEEMKKLPEGTLYLSPVLNEWAPSEYSGWKMSPEWAYLYAVPDADKVAVGNTSYAFGGIMQRATVPHSQGSFKPVTLPDPKQPDILEEALAVTKGDRQADYGDMTASFTRIAALWSAYKGVEFTPKDVASMMILLKISRSTTSDKRDNWVDMAGYARCGSIVSQKP